MINIVKNVFLVLLLLVLIAESSQACEITMPPKSPGLTSGAVYALNKLFKNDFNKETVIWHLILHHTLPLTGPFKTTVTSNEIEDLKQDHFSISGDTKHPVRLAINNQSRDSHAELLLEFMLNILRTKFIPFMNKQFDEEYKPTWTYPQKGSIRTADLNLNGKPFARFFTQSSVEVYLTDDEQAQLNHAFASMWRDPKIRSSFYHKQKDRTWKNCIVKIESIVVQFDSRGVCGIYPATQDSKAEDAQ